MVLYDNAGALDAAGDEEDPYQVCDEVPDRNGVERGEPLPRPGLLHRRLAVRVQQYVPVPIEDVENHHGDQRD